MKPLDFAAFLITCYHVCCCWQSTNTVSQNIVFIFDRAIIVRPDLRQVTIAPRKITQIRTVVKISFPVRRHFVVVNDGLRVRTWAKCAPRMQRSQWKQLWPAARALIDMSGHCLLSVRYLIAAGESSLLISGSSDLLLFPTSMVRVSVNSFVLIKVPVEIED